MSDPFTMVYDALWDLAEGSNRVTDMVRLGNRIKMRTTAPNPGLKRQVSQGDLPELVLALTSGSGNLLNTSSSSMVTKQYAWQLATGSLNPERLLELEFALFAALVDWPAILGALTWSGAEFVKRANLVGMESGAEMAEQNRGILGWASVWTLEVEMHFRTSDLRTYGLGTGSGS